MTSSLPSNRATRLRVRASLDLAEHASDLLASKEEALERERTRLQGHADRTTARWHDSVSDAASRLLRARALGAGPELKRLSSPREPATLTVAWQTSMGINYPGSVECTPGPVPSLLTTSALVPATDAYRKALEDAAQHAAAMSALRRVEAELANTRRRRRALEQHLQPRLRAQLHDLDLALDEHDRDAALRTQIALRRKEARR